jgi:hypothetical protein
MNWQSAILIAVLFLAIGFTTVRSVARARLWILLLVGLPTLFFSLRWAAFRTAWSEWLFGAGAASLVLLVWWIALGRRLQPPCDENIRVWTEDDPF